MVPTAQMFPFDASVHWPKTVAGREMDTYHRWMEVVIGGTLSGNPVVNVPVGFDEQGRPMGVQCIGRMGQDKEVLEFAMAYEKVTEIFGRLLGQALSPTAVTKMVAEDAAYVEAYYAQASLFCMPTNLEPFGIPNNHVKIICAPADIW